MIRNLTYIGLAIMVLAEVIFDNYAPEKSTNWSIFYFASFYTGGFLISLEKVFINLDKFNVQLAFLFASFFITMVINLLIKINMPYDKFMISVNDTFIDVVRYLFMGVAGIVITFKIFITWVKRWEK